MRLEESPRLFENGSGCCSTASASGSFLWFTAILAVILFAFSAFLFYTQIAQSAGGSNP